MDRLRSGPLRRFDDPLTTQVALARRCGADVYGLVRSAHVRCPRVRVAVHGDGAHAQLVTGSNHAQRDLAPVGD